MTSEADITFNENLTYINGPINVVRLEGKVGKIKKTIYLFMDQHYDLYNQTECDNVYAQDIQNYLATNFKKLNGSDTTYDFFLEIYPSDLQNIRYGESADTMQNFRKIYIFEVFKLFRKIFSFDPKQNKVSISKYFTNVRLHYSDIRSYFFGDIFDNKFGYIFNQLEYMLRNNVIWIQGMDNMINTMNGVIASIEHFTSIIKKVKDTKTKKNESLKPTPIKFRSENTETLESKPAIKETTDEEYVEYFLNKLFYNYTNKSIQPKIIDEIDVFIQKLERLQERGRTLIKTMTNVVAIQSNTQFRLVRKKNSNEISYGIPFQGIVKILADLRIDIIDFDNEFIDVFMMFMDVYFLRRFLDKDYITNAITYTGSAHSVYYIKTLVEKFDFEITHAALSDMDLSQINKKITDLSTADLEEIFYPAVRSQCSDVTNFPKNFL